MIDLERIREAVARRSGAQIALFAWQQNPDAQDWGTVTHDGQAAAIWGDGGMREQAHEGSVHLFCRSATSAAPAGVQDALQELGVSWRLDDVLYEQDTRLLHWVWIWQDWGDSP